MGGLEGQGLCPGHLGATGDMEIGKGQGNILEVGDGLEGETRGWEGFLSGKR